MRIERLTVLALRIPFIEKFRHAAHIREESDAVVVRVEDSEGHTGYGEGLPRPYVTGETVDSLVASVRRDLGPLVLGSTFTSLNALWAFLQAARPDWTRPRTPGGPVVAANAAFCAVELALLDCAFRAAGVSLASQLPPARDAVSYGGVISADSPRTAGRIAGMAVAYGLEELKVKVGTPEDKARLEAVRAAAGTEVVLRADANGAWTAAQAIEQLRRLDRFGLVSIEQPVAAADIDGMRAVREASGIPVVADESVVTVDQARILVAARACDAFNIRVSKCGGITGALAVARVAEAAGLRTLVGAQVGETAILTAAGRHLAAHLPDLLTAEGSYNRFLLADDVAEEDLTFDYGGVGPRLGGAGLGITIKPEVLEGLAHARWEVRP